MVILFVPFKGELQIDGNPLILKEESDILASSDGANRITFSEPLQDWEDYYKWRGFSLNSPAAVLLSPILTLYHILVTLPPQQCK